MKKTISIILSLLMMLSVLSVSGISALAANEKTDSYEYKVRDDGTVAIMKYIGSDYDVVIPEEIDGKKVTKINNNAFVEPYWPYLGVSGVSSIRTITIPKTVDLIGTYNFYNLPFLNNIFVDEENEKYTSEKGVLYTKDMKTLKCYPTARLDNYYEINSKTETIYYVAFYGSKYLTSVKIPKNVKSIMPGAFTNCASIEDFYVPSTVKKIGNNAIGVKTVYYTGWYDPRDTASKSDDWDASEQYEMDYAPTANVTVYGKKGSAAEKYIKSLKKRFNEAKKFPKFKTLSTKKPTLKTKVKGGKLTVTASGYEKLSEYEICVIKGKKKIKSYYAVMSQTDKFKTTLKLDKGTYKIKVRARIWVGGYSFKTPYSKTVTVKIK